MKFSLPVRRMLSIAAIFIALVWPARALELHTERASKFDLEVTGQITGLPAGESRYVRWSDLRALPTEKLSLDGEFVAGKQEVTVVYLTELWQALPRSETADMVLATCTDGYLSVYPIADFEKYKPMVVLEINGLGPDTWPPPGLNYNPGPYIITVSETVAPAVAGLLDGGHKKPWSVAKIELVNYQQRFAAAYSGAWAQLSEKAASGREIWVNSCLSCHGGPAGIPGGIKSGRPFEVLRALAGYSPDYFRRYVRAPRDLVPEAKMEPHPHYTDAHLNALIAFITAESPGAAKTGAP